VGRQIFGLHCINAKGLIFGFLGQHYEALSKPLSRSFLFHARAHTTTQPFDNGRIILFHDVIDDVKGLNKASLRMSHGLQCGPIMKEKEMEQEVSCNVTLGKEFHMFGHVDVVVMYERKNII